MLIRFARWSRHTLLSLLGLESDIDAAKEYREALDWQKERPPSADNADKLEFFKAIHEYGETQFNELIATHEKSTAQAESLLRLNAVLLVGLFAYFKSQPMGSVPWAAKFAGVFWMVAMLVIAVAIRRCWRPTRQDLRTMQEFVTKDDKRMYAWMNTYTHAAIIKYRVIINNEAGVINYSLAFTMAGILVLLIATLLG